jgi:hypothetical protein
MTDRIEQIREFTKTVAYLSIVWGDILGIVLIILSGNKEYSQYLDNMIGLLMTIAGLEQLNESQ